MTGTFQDVEAAAWSLAEEVVSQHDVENSQRADEERIMCKALTVWHQDDDRSFLLSAMISSGATIPTMKRVAEVVPGNKLQLTRGSLRAIVGGKAFLDDLWETRSRDLLVSMLTGKEGDLLVLYHRAGVDNITIACMLEVLRRGVRSLESSPMGAGRLADYIATSAWGGSYAEEFGSGEFDELLGTRGLLASPRLTRLRRGLVYSGSHARHIINRWVPFVANRIR